MFSLTFSFIYNLTPEPANSGKQQYSHSFMYPANHALRYMYVCKTHAASLLCEMRLHESCKKSLTTQKKFLGLVRFQ